MFKKSGIAFIYKPRFLSTMHLGQAKCIIISNRRTNSTAAMGSVSAENSENSNGRNIYSDYETENDYNNEEDMDDCIAKMNDFDDEDRICLSHFSPYDH